LKSIKEQKFQDQEKEKTPEQKEVIAFINQYLPEFIKRYGGNPLVISEDKVHIMPEEALGDFEGEDKEAAAFYCPDDQSVYFKENKNGSLLGFAKILVHEFIHFNAFQTVRIKEEKDELYIQRIGFKIRGAEGGLDYFDFVDESITEELNRRFSDEFFKKSLLLKKDIEKFEKVLGATPPGVIKNVEDLSYYNNAVKEDGSPGIVGVYYGCPKERKKVNNLITNLYEKNKDDFKSREEIFNLFAQAILSGRLLPVARLIEKTYGKGSFRKLGKKFSGKMEKRII